MPADRPSTVALVTLPTSSAFVQDVLLKPQHRKYPVTVAFGLGHHAKLTAADWGMFGEAAWTSRDEAQKEIPGSVTSSRHNQSRKLDIPNHCTPR